MDKKRFRPLIVSLVIIFSLIYGTYNGFVKNVGDCSDKTDIVSIIQFINSYSSTLSGSFISRFFSILIHNYLLDIFYSIIACLTLGISGIITSFTSGNTFGYVLQINCSIPNIFFVSLEAISMAILTCFGTSTGWTLITKNKKVKLKNFIRVLLIVFILLTIASLIETLTIKEIIR